MLLYYITDRSQFAGTETPKRESLLEKVADAARAEIDYIQVREKDLSSRDLEELASEIVRCVRAANSATKVLINSRTDIALAAGADGVHLRSNDVSPADVRRVWMAAGLQSRPVIAVSCHSEEEVNAAKLAGADFCVFAPVFGKSGGAAVGLTALEAACRHSIPVLALGGVTAENALPCIDAGAAGIAAIRLFQESNVANTARDLRQLRAEG